jgi:threonine synthase
MTGRDADAVRNTYDTYKQVGEASLPDEAVSRLKCSGLSASSVSNDETMGEMKRFEQETGWQICPHTAVGTFHARRLPVAEVKTVVLATAAAAKFPETVEEATGRKPTMPARAEVLYEQEEVFERTEASLAAVRARIEQHAGRSR